MGSPDVRVAASLFLAVFTCGCRSARDHVEELEKLHDPELRHREVIEAPNPILAFLLAPAVALGYQLPTAPQRVPDPPTVCFQNLVDLMEEDFRDPPLAGRAVVRFSEIARSDPSRICRGAALSLLGRLGRHRFPAAGPARPDAPVLDKDAVEKEFRRLVSAEVHLPSGLGHPEGAEATCRELLRTLAEGRYPALIPARAGLRLLESFARTDESAANREVALRGIGPVARAVILMTLEASLSAPEEDLRVEAVEALGRIADPSSAPAIGQALKADPHSLVRRKAALSLGNFRSGASIDALIGALADQDRGLREVAAGALRRLTGEAFPAEPARWQDWWEQNRAAFTAGK